MENEITRMVLWFTLLPMILRILRVSVVNF